MHEQPATAAHNPFVVRQQLRFVSRVKCRHRQGTLRSAHQRAALAVARLSLPGPNGVVNHSHFLKSLVQEEQSHLAELASKHGDDDVEPQETKELVTSVSAGDEFNDDRKRDDELDQLMTRCKTALDSRCKAEFDEARRALKEFSSHKGKYIKMYSAVQLIQEILELD